MSMKLYDLAGAEDDRRFSPFCWRAKLALAHKGLDAQKIAWRFTEKEKLAPTNQPRVPVLVDGDTWIADSWAIALHLEKAYPDKPSLFGHPAAVGPTRFLNHWMDNTIHPLIARMLVADIYAHCAEKDKEYFRTSREERFGKTLDETSANRDTDVIQFRQLLHPLRLTLSEQSFLGGETPTYADYVAVAGFFWARSISSFRLLADDDSLVPWRERMLDLHGGMARKSPGYDT